MRQQALAVAAEGSFEEYRKPRGARYFCRRSIFNLNRQGAVVFPQQGFAFMEFGRYYSVCWPVKRTGMEGRAASACCRPPQPKSRSSEVTIIAIYFGGKRYGNHPGLRERNPPYVSRGLFFSNRGN